MIRYDFHGILGYYIMIK